MILQPSRAGRRYGAFPSPPLASDYGFPAHLARVAGPFPVRAQLSGAIGPVKNQGSQGSCTGHGSTSLGERLYRRWKGATPIFSPAYTYYAERQLEGTLADGDCGANVVSSVIVADPNAAGGSGWCPLAYMPYDDTVCNLAPNPTQIAAAKEFPGGAYHSIGNNIANIKSCILSDYSFVIGLSVFESFEDDSTAASGLIPYPNVEQEQLVGGHEMHSGIAYDDTIQCPGSPNPGAVLTQNSWGTQWGTTAPQSGERGFAWISYDYLMDKTLMSDVRLAHLGKPW